MAKYATTAVIRDGNAMMIIGAVRYAMKKAGAPDDDISAFTKKARSGDYANVLATAEVYVEIELQE